MTTMTIYKELLDELLSCMKRPEDLLRDKGLMKRMLNAELTEHLGYEPHGEPTSEQTNRRNGATRKVLKGNEGAVRIDIPRDRSSHRNCVSTAGQWMAVSSRSRSRKARPGSTG
jgi:putative transposase